MRRSFLLTTCVAALVFFCGCSHFIFSPYFQVEQSGLNWVSIRHYTYTATPIQRVNVRIDGNGMVTVREGASMLVTNPFAANDNDPYWNDVRENRLMLSPDEVLPLFQMLVDKGLFKERVRSRNAPANTNEAIFVSANIGGKTCGSEDDIFTIDPDLADHLKMVMLMFYHPQPRHRRSK